METRCGSHATLDTASSDSVEEPQEASTPTAPTDADLDSWRSTLALVHTRIKEALTSQDSLNALRYAQTGNFAQQNVLLLEGRPTEILGGLPEHQSQLTAILARFQRTTGRALTKMPIDGIGNPDGSTVSDPSRSPAALGRTSADLTSGPLVKVPRRYKGRKDHWPEVPKIVTQDTTDVPRT